MTISDAGRAAAPAPSPPPAPGPSFLRRHPVLSGFGVLAALSLFATYWPASAIVTGVLVAGRATGADAALYRAARRGIAELANHILHFRHRDEAAEPPATPTPPEPAAGSPSPPAADGPSPSPASPVPPPPPSPRGPARQRRPRPPAEAIGAEERTTSVGL